MALWNLLTRTMNLPRYAAGLPTLAADSGGRALDAGDLPDFREWGKV